MAKRYKPKTPPFPHQSRATVKALRARSFALFMEPRTGKTKAAIDYVGVLALKGEVSRVLVLCPKIAIDVWIDQLKQHAGYKHSWETTTEEVQRGGVRFYIVNYEKAALRHRSRGGHYTYPYLSELERWRPDVVVCDESHRLKRSGGVTSQAVWRFVRRLRTGADGSRKPFVLLLSGTPNPKGWIDLFAQYRVMDDSIFGTTKTDFEEDYCTYGIGSRKWTVVSYRNEKKLLKKVRAHSITVTADQAGLAGEQFTQNLWCTLPSRAREQYNEMAEEFITEVEHEQISAKNQGVKRTRLLQITGGFTTSGVQVHPAKLTVLKDYLHSLIDQEEKRLVVYARFSPEVAACAEVSEHLGFDTTIIQGGTKRSVSSDALKRFQQVSSRPTALVFQVQVGSLSIELSAAAEVVFYSLPDGWDTYKQCRDRVLGPNQRRPVRYTHILSHSTVDLSVLGGLVKKEDWHATLMKSPRRYLYGMDTS